MAPPFGLIERSLFVRPGTAILEANALGPLHGVDLRVWRDPPPRQRWADHTHLKNAETAPSPSPHADRTQDLDGAVTEDELWTTICLDPWSLPAGEVKLVPGTMFLRLSHRPWKAERATARLEPADGDLLADTLE